jgi:hypothetical protein
MDGDIQIGLIDGHLLHEFAGETMDDGHDLAGFGLVSLHARPDEHAFRTKPARRDARHGGAHAELARLVAGRRDHAALRGRRAHDHRPPAQRRLIPLLHRRVERVHVEMEDDAVHDRLKQNCPWPWWSTANA